MSAYYKFIQNYLDDVKCAESSKYCEVGHSFTISNENLDGNYWFYETEDFIINIHDFFIKKELLYLTFPDMSQFMSFSSTYVITANGECFHPYQTLTSNSLYLFDPGRIDKNYRFLLHGDFPYLTIGLNFKKQMIEDYLSSIKDAKNVRYSDIFFDTKAIVTTSLKPLAKDILNCKMTSPAAEIFFEAKAKEWLSITIDAFLNRKNIHISVDDDIALKNVANYLDDHYAINVTQKTLEKIAMMSGTKLKKLFKQKYQVSITEYTQRKRMNIAETLLLNSSLKIQDISEAVGYSSHNKFSTYFKKYKGMYPRDLRKQWKKGL